MSFGIIDIIISDLIDRIIPVTMAEANGVDTSATWEEREMMRLRILELEAQLESASLMEEGVQTLMLRGRDPTSTLVPSVGGRRPTPQVPFHKVALPTYDGKDPSLYRDLENKFLPCSRGTVQRTIMIISTTYRSV